MHCNSFISSILQYCHFLPLFQCVWEKYECLMSYMRNKPIRSDKWYSSDKIISLYLALNMIYLSPAYHLASKSSLLLEILILCPTATKYCPSDTGIISRCKVLPKLTTQNRIILYKFMNTYAANINTGTFITKSFLIISPLACQKRNPCFHFLPHILWGKEGHWTQQCHIPYLNIVPLTTSDCFTEVLQVS